MIHRVAMWQLKDFAEGKTRLENARLMKELPGGLKEGIPNIVE